MRLLRSALLILATTSIAMPYSAGGVRDDFAAGGQRSGDLLLGVLEDVPGMYAGESDTREVRAVFRKAGTEWEPFPTDCKDVRCLDKIEADYPAEVTWTIAFDGRSLGRVTSRTPQGFKFYSDMGLQQIVSTEPVPTVGEKSRKYGGFLDEPVYRPLVAVSQPNVQDPEQWKPSALPPNVSTALRREFRKKFPNVSNCRNPEENAEKRWPYRDADVAAIKTYSSKPGWLLVSLQLQEWRCDGPSEDTATSSENDNPFALRWYAVAPNGDISFVGSAIWLIDAGDYDNDGKSELLFAIDGYDLGGYELFYNDFKSYATFEFGYH